MSELPTRAVLMLDASDVFRPPRRLTCAWPGAGRQPVALVTLAAVLVGGVHTAAVTADVRPDGALVQPQHGRERAQTLVLAWTRVNIHAVMYCTADKSEEFSYSFSRNRSSD